MPVLPAEGREAELDAEASRHLVQVLRVGPGEAVVLFDGKGWEAPGLVVHAHKRTTVVRCTGPATDRRPPTEVHLLLGVPKQPAMDLAVRMATEAGVTHLHPVQTARAVPRDPRAERWDRIALSAAEQCGRADVPEVLPVAPLVTCIQRLDHVADRRVALPGGPAGGRAASHVAVLVGPEGGLTDEEVRAALQADFAPLGLAPFTLRACTAAAVAVAVVVPLASELGAPSR